MSRLPSPSALLAATAAGVLVALSSALPVTAAPTTARTAAATPTPAASAPHYSYPPQAPKPTSTANSPDAPDPKPPRGGIGPLGQPVGGARLLSRGLILPPKAPALPSGINAAGWIVVDLDSGDVIAARDPHGRYQPASILKTLTSITLIPRLPGNRVITANQTAANAEGSAAGLVGGGRYTVDELFHALLLVSANDAAAALAEANGGVRRTVAMMNAEALSLGAYDTYVQTPSGLDGWSQLTSAYDMAIFLRAAVNLPRFVAYDRAPTSALPPEKVPGASYGSVPLDNQNETFLTTVPGALVAKTGFTDAARHTYLAAVRRDHRRIGVIMMRGERWPVDQWQQATSLVGWALALPAGTRAVGHLDPPVRRPSDTASPATSNGRVDAGAAHTNGGGGTPLGLKIGIIAAILAAGGLLSRLIRRSGRAAGPSN